jgi:hypothetical protein
VSSAQFRDHRRADERKLHMAIPVEERKGRQRERAVLYRLKKGIKPRPPAMPPEERKRRHRDASARRRRAQGVAPRVVLTTPEEKHDARKLRQARYRFKKRMKALRRSCASENASDRNALPHQMARLEGEGV